MISIQDKILSRIQRQGRGGVVTPKDFLDLAGRDAVDQVLSRLSRAGEIDRLGRGLYHYPRVNELLRIPLAPDADEIAAALGRQTGSRVAPSGAVAANRLGLSTQVPAKHVYLSDGRARRVTVGGLEFQIRHVAPKDLPPGGRTSAMVFQALRYLGRDAVDDRVVGHLRSVLGERERRALLRDARYATDWIAAAVREVAAGGAESRG